VTDIGADGSAKSGTQLSIGARTFFDHLASRATPGTHDCGWLMVDMYEELKDELGEFNVFKPLHVEFQSTRMCTACDKLTEVRHPLGVIIDVTIPPGVAVPRLDHCMHEYVEGCVNVSAHCPSCGTQCCHRDAKRITEVSEVAVVHVSRFDREHNALGGAPKDVTEVSCSNFIIRPSCTGACIQFITIDFLFLIHRSIFTLAHCQIGFCEGDELWNLGQHVSPIADIWFRLETVVLHKGDSLSNGSFAAIVRLNGGGLLKMSAHNVETFHGNISDICQKSHPCMFVYRRMRCADGISSADDAAAAVSATALRVAQATSTSLAAATASTAQYAAQMRSASKRRRVGDPQSE
jgi:hypothetical protein